MVKATDIQLYGTDASYHYIIQGCHYLETNTCSLFLTTFFFGEIKRGPDVGSRGVGRGFFGGVTSSPIRIKLGNSTSTQPQMIDFFFSLFDEIVKSLIAIAPITR